MIDLNRAAVFVRVVETGGFTRAAEAIGVPPSSVSRSVSKLEAELGVTLLERTTRHVGLTDAGRAFFERARNALLGLTEASALAVDAALEVHGVVRIALPPDFGAQSGTLFAEFAALYPRIRLEITFTPRGEELVGDLVDLAVTIGRLPDSALVAKKIGNATHRLFAAPGYIKRHGQPKKLADLSNHEVLLMRAHAGTARWEMTGPRGVEHVDVVGRLVADHLQLIIDAAIAGLGIASLPAQMGERAKLIPVLPLYGVETPLHVLTHGARHLPHRVALLRDHLALELRGQCRKHEQ